jgi:hypothetical protein
MPRVRRARQRNPTISPAAPRARDHHDGVVMSELLVPKFLEVVATRIVETGKFPIVESWFSGGTTGIAHRPQEILAPGV